MKALIEKVSKQTGVDAQSTKAVIEAVALELTDSEAQTAFITASKPLHRAHLESGAAKLKAQDEVKSEKKSAKKASKAT